jgi:glycosyltransferase involved in cell wall biosynthesis
MLKKDNSYDNIEICIVSPGLVETGTNRGGGCEVTDFNVGLQCSKNIHFAIFSTYVNKYNHIRHINDKFKVINIPIRAQKEYPISNKKDSFITFILTIIFSIIVSYKVFLLTRHQLKVLIIHNPQTGFIPMLIGKIFGIRVVFSEGNVIPWTNPYLKKMSFNTGKRIHNYLNLNFNILMCRFSNHIRTQSFSIKNGMVGYGIPKDQITVIPAGIDPDEFKPLNKSQIKSKSINIGFIGRLVDIKGVPLLYKIIQKAIVELPEANFFIYGDGPYKNLFVRLSNVKWVGYISRDKLNTELKKIDLTLFFQKELGRAEIESMAAGKVSIFSDIGEMKYRIEHLNNGYLCNPDAGSYIDAIKILSDDVQLFNKISMGSRISAINQYSWENIGEKWCKLFNKILSSK